MQLKDKRCPTCLGSGQRTNTVGFSAYDGRPLQLPCQCPTCKGRGFIKGDYYNKLLDAQRLAHDALRGAS